MSEKQKISFNIENSLLEKLKQKAGKNGRDLTGQIVFDLESRFTQPSKTDVQKAILSTAMENRALLLFLVKNLLLDGKAGPEYEALKKNFSDGVTEWMKNFWSD